MTTKNIERCEVHKSVLIRESDQQKLDKIKEWTQIDKDSQLIRIAVHYYYKAMQELHEK